MILTPSNSWTRWTELSIWYVSHVKEKILPKSIYPLEAKKINTHIVIDQPTLITDQQEYISTPLGWKANYFILAMLLTSSSTVNSK